MSVSLHECSSKADNREFSQNKTKQGQKSNEKKHKHNIQYLSTLPISAGKSARSRYSLDHAEILKGGFDPCLVKHKNTTEMALDAKMALDAGTLRCQPAEQKHLDNFFSTKEMSINRHQGLLSRVIILLEYAKKAY